ncbi:N-formylmethionyl-tRNA deformylase [Chromobacterium violaceum]|uniref:N-formylmethionyl-tRNA deformylase n=1 Tax=Chromobacterium violaceum TaxID=536 RepID=A0A3S4I2B2_CHRVL|nr:N-formylmethionyl-tRNA deformylase [Chromobacterium violaceum]
MFSQFVDHLALVAEHLRQRGVRFHYLDGGTPTRQRKASMDAFQAGDGDLFLISLKAGGTGLNLTAADYVIHLDPWWNPAVEDQASDRAYRMGQQRPVTVYRLVAAGTIEEKIVELHRDKRALADSLLAGGDASASMDGEALLALLRGEAG